MLLAASVASPLYIVRDLCLGTVVYLACWEVVTYEWVTVSANYLKRFAFFSQSVVNLCIKKNAPLLGMILR